jgi:hypothetical protein
MEGMLNFGIYILNYMTPRFFRFLFLNRKKYYKSRYEILVKDYKLLYERFQVLQNNLKKNSQALSNLKFILDKETGVTKISKTKNGCPVLIVTWPNPPDTYIQVYSFEQSELVEVLVIINIIPGERIYIHDFQSRGINQGFGEVALDWIIKLAHEHKVKEIRGKISEADRDHWDRLEHFYKKKDLDVNFTSKTLLKTIS